MENHASSFVSKARTAFHSAAAKAERVLMDFKIDLDSDKQFHDDEFGRQRGDESARSENESKFLNELKRTKWRPPRIGTKQDWQDRINMQKRRKEVEVTDNIGDVNMGSLPFYDENLYILNVKNDLDAKASEAIPTVEGLTAATTSHSSIICPEAVGYSY